MEPPSSTRGRGSRNVSPCSIATVGFPCCRRRHPMHLPERRTAMQNAHLRMCKLTFVRQTRDTITNITVGLNCLVAEPGDSQTATTLHLVSIFGGDQDIGAVLAAAHEALRFRVATDACDFVGTL